MEMKTGGHVSADERGFTLAELLVAIAILGLIMIGVLTLLMTGNQSYLTGSNQAEAQAAVRAGLERMTLDIREAGYGPTTDQNCDPALGFPAVDQSLAPSPTPPPPLFLRCFNAVINPTPTSFTLQADWNGANDGVNGIQAGVVVQINYRMWNGAAFVDTPVNRGEQVTYSVVGGNLQRQESAVDAQPQILVTSVQQASAGGALQPAFQYLDANGQVIANPGANPWQIRTIWVQMRVGVQNQPPAIWQAGAVQVTMSDRIRLRNRM